MRTLSLGFMLALLFACAPESKGDAQASKAATTAPAPDQAPETKPKPEPGPEPKPEPEPEPEPEPPSLEELAKACEGGDAQACLAALDEVRPRGAYRGELSDEEADRRKREAAGFSARACELGSGEGCLLQARYGPWDERTIPLEAGCKLDHIGCCAHLGRALLGSKGAKGKRAEELLERACRAAYHDDRWFKPGRACDTLAVGTKDPAKAKVFRALACEQGYVLRCPCKVDDDCPMDDGICVELEDEEENGLVCWLLPG